MSNGQWEVVGKSKKDKSAKIKDEKRNGSKLDSYIGKYISIFTYFKLFTTVKCVILQICNVFLMFHLKTLHKLCTQSMMMRKGSQVKKIRRKMVMIKRNLKNRTRKLNLPNQSHQRL